MYIDDKIWWTRKSRIEAASRLHRKNFHAELLLVWYAFLSACAAIYFLQFTHSSAISEVSAVVFSVFVLSVSLYINGRDLSKRAFYLEQSYKELGELYDEVKTLGRSSINLNQKYKLILQISENHSEIDFISAKIKLYLSGEKIDKKPTRYDYFRLLRYQLRSLVLLVTVYSLPALFLAGIILK